MSLFECVDQLRDFMMMHLDKLNHQEILLISELKTLLEIKAESLDLTQNWEKELYLIEKMKLNDKFKTLIEKIKDEVDDIKKAHLSHDILKEINYSEIGKFIDAFKFDLSFLPKSPLDEFDEPQYCVLKFSQGRIPSFGHSAGYCYGFALAMADPHQSFYDRDKALIPVSINQTIHDYQYSQVDFKHEAKERVERNNEAYHYFFDDADPCKQAEILWDMGRAQPEQHFMIIKQALISYSGSHSHHACYMKMVKDKIYYMDPNHGAYQFEKKEDFIRFYCAVNSVDNRPYSKLALQHLEYSNDPCNTKPMSIRSVNPESIARMMGLKEELREAASKPKEDHDSPEPLTPHGPKP